MHENHGQEVIFESASAEEAGQPLPVTKPAAFAEESDEAIHRDHLNPYLAYQQFHSAMMPASAVDVFSIATGNEKKMESPFQRLHRLRSELSELNQDLDSLAQTDQQAVWAALKADAQGLASQVNDLAAHPAWQSKAAPKLVDLAAPLQQSQASAQASTTCAQNDEESLTSLEHRVHRLELLLGQQMNLTDLSASSTTTPDVFPVLPTLQRLERKVSMLEPQLLETLRTKANLLKWELEGICGKKKDGSSAGNEAKVLEALRKVDAVAAQVAKVQSFADDLPALVLRLKTLERVHWSAATAQARMTQLEEALQQARAGTQENGAVLSEIKEGLRANLESMQRNIEHVESRLRANEQS